MVVRNRGREGGRKGGTEEGRGIGRVKEGGRERDILVIEKYVP